MSKKEFDELLIKKLGEEELAYDPASWEKLARRLSPPLSVRKRNMWLVATGIAAGIALLTGILLLAPIFRGANPEPGSTPLMKAYALKALPAAPSERQSIPSSPTAPSRTWADARRLPASAAGASPVAGRPSPVLQEASAEAGLQPEEAVLATVPPVAETTKSKEEDRSMRLPGTPATDYYPDAGYLKRNNEKNTANTQLAVAGGMNYGNMNAGYTVGVSARTRLAGDFFVDGTIAMMYNNNTNDVAVNKGPALGDNLAARPTTVMPVASPALAPIQRLYYVQFNPSVGYQIDNVALSVGADFQQMLNNTDGQEKVQLSSNTARLFPNFDVGLTTKSEFNITRNIQAGLMYREGLTNLLRNDINKYVNRRYLQVQFKYNIPVN